ncbi:hypothetical protein GCM10027202_13200 [Microvirgula curvata]
MPRYFMNHGVLVLGGNSFAGTLAYPEQGVHALPGRARRESAWPARGTQLRIAASLVAASRSAVRSPSSTTGW